MLFCFYHKTITLYPWGLHPASCHSVAFNIDTALRYTTDVPREFTARIYENTTIFAEFENAEVTGRPHWAKGETSAGGHNSLLTFDLNFHAESIYVITKTLLALPFYKQNPTKVIKTLSWNILFCSSQK